MNSFLFSCISVTYGDGISRIWIFLSKRIEVNHDTVRRTYFVLATIALADIAVVIPRDITKFFFKHHEYLSCLGDKFRLVLEERRDSDAIWSEMYWNFEVCAHFTTHFIFSVGFREHGGKRTTNTK